MPLVTIGATEYEVYSSLADADTYFNASIQFVEWDAFSDDQKSRGLVSATRLIDRQDWQGEKTEQGSPTQNLEFPRTGLTHCSGTSVGSDESLDIAVEASQMLAFDLLDGQELETSKSTEDLTKRLKAGSVEIEYFRADLDSAARFPTDVMELLGCFLAGGAAIAGSISTGTDGTALDDDFDFNRGI
jgi:hypothetical protein